jgi:electron transfer flavoprotein alpha subunit
MKTQRDIIVFLESSGEKAEIINRALLAEGGRIAGLLGGKLLAMTVGDAAADVMTALAGEYGSSTLYCVEGSDLSAYSCEAFAWAATVALRGIPSRLILFAHSDRGSELAPRIAYGLDTAVVSDCADIRVRQGELFYVRQPFGGQFEQEVSYKGGLPEIATIRTEAAAGRKAPTPTSPGVVVVPAEVPSGLARTKSLDVTPPDFRTVDILYAKRIIGVGSGCGPLLALAEELALLLRGSVGTTRPVVDDGYIPKKRMIGQTGKTVAPELYMGLGVSGSPHHVAGIQQSGEIMSVNLDPRAPIFNFSDAAFVADLKGLLPKLIDRIKRYRDEGLA